MVCRFVQLHMTFVSLMLLSSLAHCAVTVLVDLIISLHVSQLEAVLWELKPAYTPPVDPVRME